MSSPQTASSVEPPSDKVDLAELVRGVEPYSGDADYAIPDFFGSDQEHAEFVAWYRAEREKELA